MNHRITEWFGLEGTFGIIWFRPPSVGRDTLDRVARGPVQPGLECFQKGEYTDSLGGLFRCLTALAVGSFFPVSSSSLRPFPLVWPLPALTGGPSPAFLRALSGIGGLLWGLLGAF